jgi:FMN-dependent NADH-azoreductase
VDQAGGGQLGEPVGEHRVADPVDGWIRRTPEGVWHLDLRVVEREFTLVGVNPALDAFTDLAAELKATAEREAHENGRWLPGNRRTAA